MTRQPDARGAATRHPTYDPADSVVRARGLCRRFTPDAGVLDGVDLDLGAGEVVALVGRRGSGRASLLRALAREDREVAASGYLRLPERIARLDRSADTPPWKRALDHVAAAVDGPASRRPARQALAEVGLIDQEAAWIGDLDAVDRARLALARVLVTEPELILADQPWRDLLPLERTALHGALRAGAARRGAAVLLVTNEPPDVLEVADRVLVLVAGRVDADLAVRAGDAALLTQLAEVVREASGDAATVAPIDGVRQETA